ncbi:spore germination protein [Paenibacillus sp. UNCCL117]|uniref:Ger(x)C family spore germination protein n=1 Tax=unclassified Paenibacillus TaxID=185978 RepID=UPI00087E2411|nr:MULTISPECIES: Ger(x)C family spore germination protein [unclassified Paenibacillus]SDC55736.1 spore germination protein [Paenibacillus sp. cl123]SFW10895.1 spore germination protein [Paenibacillus sp. UNCCL117]
MKACGTLRIAIALTSLMILNGCWDRVEIEDVGITLGIGFDMPDKNTMPSDKEKQLISMTHHFAIPEQFSSKGGTTAKKSYTNLASTGEQVLENVSEISMRLSRTPSYEHLRVIVINENVAKTIALKNIINFLLRNSETRRSMPVLISQGPTIQVFEKEAIATNPAVKLRGMTENFRKTLSIPPSLKLGDLSEKLTGKKSFVIQKVVTTATESKLSGAAVVKGETGKMAGWLSEEETTGLNLLYPDHQRRGVIKGIDKRSGGPLVFEVHHLNRKITPRLFEDRVDFEVELNVVGRLREDWVFPGNAFDQEFVARSESAIKQSIERLINKALSKTQKTFKVDVAGFGKRLQIKNPKLWSKLKDNWDDRFTQSVINVKVVVKIIEFGTTATKKG